ncbi:DUF3455 domain-containing protein [Tardiphaga alba]|uniref:DUF3455 domain-containing protein n=2 Tax=Tardiphaga alba TaxID=340268 RepID=A0ABX8AID7_9BRAD|nr:DUF3455 domain-containing protein [Tardiphaga alba]
MPMIRTSLAVVAPLIALSATASAQVPQSIAEPDATIVAIYHAEGTQIYECTADADKQLSWVFREPTASLFADGLTVGRHYAGPRWELSDGSIVAAKPVGRAPGKTAGDIQWLKLAVTVNRGDGKLAHVDVIQRINTSGGVASGRCEEAGQLLNVPYSADYAFLRKD